MTDFTPLQCFGLGFIVGLFAYYLVRQMLTGELGEDEEQRHPDYQEGFK